VLNEQSEALAFVIDLGSDLDDPDAPPVTTGHRTAVYVYRHVKNEAILEYKEIPNEAIVTRLGTAVLSELLEPRRLEAVFAR
jgi:hypothetical protein